MNTRIVQEELQALLMVLDVSYKDLAGKHESLQAEMNRVDGERKIIRDALQLYREMHGLPGEPDAASEVLRQQFKGKSYKDILIEIARENGGLLSGKDATRILIAAGLFPNKAKGAARVYSTIGRFPAIFKRIGRGKYRIESSNGSAVPNPADFMPQTNNPVPR